MARAGRPDDDEQGDGELRGDDAKGGVTPPSRFLLSLSKHLIHCHLQTAKIAFRINSNRVSFVKCSCPKIMRFWNTWSETRLCDTRTIYSVIQANKLFSSQSSLGRTVWKITLWCVSDRPTHSCVITISFSRATSPWGGWRGERCPACAWNTGSPPLVGP